MNHITPWNELPYRVREHLVGEAELEYDPYEGSSAEEEGKLLCGYYDDFKSHRNFEAVERVYNDLSPEAVKKLHIDIAKRLQDEADQILARVGIFKG